MSGLRKILFPFSILYDGITSLRNKLFESGVLESKKFHLPVIIVGNLNVGGTGKTPHIEYLIRLLKNRASVAVLSRGYKRKTKGFLLASPKVSVEELGDESYQYYSKYDEIIVAVDEDRVHGIHRLNTGDLAPEIILLDDAYQHRKVDSDFKVLLTTYGDLYVDDFVLPAGNLREGRSGAHRAQIIVVSKCPQNLSETERSQIRKKLGLINQQKLFFTTIKYADEVKAEEGLVLFSELRDYEMVLITGIAKPEPLLEYLNIHEMQYEHVSFPDHHNFTDKELLEIQNKFTKIDNPKKIILTTEKDYVRLKGKISCYYLEMQIEFLADKELFDTTVNQYVVGFD